MGNKVQLDYQPKSETIQEILNSLAEGVIVADKDGKFIYFNEAAREILGIGYKDVSQQEWQSIYGCYFPDQTSPYPSDQLPLARAIRNDYVINEELFIQNQERPEGVFINVNATPLKDFNGHINGGTIIFQDITERKLDELELKKSEERIKALFKGFPIPTYVWQKADNNFILIDYNNAADTITKGAVRKYIGIDLQEMYGKTPYFKDVQSDFLLCYNEKRTVTREMTYKLQSTGETKELKVSYVFVPSNLILVHTEDVSDHKHAVAEMKKLFNAVEQTADSVVITNIDGIIEYVNPAFETTTGYSRDEIIGQIPGVLKSGKHDHKFYKNLWDTILSGQPFRDILINRKKNGTLYWCEQTITPMKETNGQITHFVSVMKDITELKKRQEQEFRLQIAREIQQQLLKVQITVPGFDIAGATYSATETSGDFFDFISMKDGNIGIVIGDVSGHGIGSALIMAQTRAYLRAFAKMESDPGIILTLLNQELVADLDEKHFVTLILAKLDPHHKSLEYSSAGHVPAYVLNKTGKVILELKSTGIPLGFMRDYKFEKSQCIQLTPENLIFFLTDGVSEAHSIHDNEFGFRRALHNIKKYRNLNSRSIVEKLYTAVQSFSRNASQEDDITSIVCKIDPVQ
ncbi:SpoIIE family protein phosphatase [candidate division KSB1 bacterium]|nr:SpoIIE family protein phosphatase [candidate division KSB1 bacterium]